MYRWDGLKCTSPFRGTRTTIGIETVHIGYARKGVPAGGDWVTVADVANKNEFLIPPWPEEQIKMMIQVGKEIQQRWPEITWKDHHGHHDICPVYKADVLGFPFAEVLRGIYNDSSIPDVWTPFLTIEGRQEALVRLGYNIGSAGVDGYWGRMSDAAFEQLEKDLGLPGDGYWTTFTCHKVGDALGV